MNKFTLLDRIRKYIDQKPWIVYGLSLLGGAVYVYQLWLYAHNQFSVLDEGAYLLKGLLFAQGTYKPFEPFGPWTNHMPLSFLIPGYVQLWIGAGIRTGRYFSIFLAVLGVVGIWLTVNQIGGRRWAAATVWGYAINPAIIKAYSIYTAQVLIFAQLSWIVFLVLNQKRKLWQLMLASFLAGVMILTRSNMMPVLAFVVIYVFWKDGKSVGIKILAAGVLPLIIGILIWPGILNFWVIGYIFNLLKISIPYLAVLAILIIITKAYKKVDLKFIQKVINPGYALLTVLLFLSVLLNIFWLNPDGPRLSIFMGISLGIRMHILPILGLLWANAIWLVKDKKNLIEKEYFSILWLFNILFLAHLAASAGTTFCEFCFPSYISFFSILGYFLIIYSINSPNIKYSKQVNWMIAFVPALLFGIAALSIPNSIKDYLLNLQVPRVRSMTILPGTSDLWRLLSNKFGYEFFAWRNIVPPVFGGMFGLFVLLVVFLSHKYFSSQGQAAISFGKRMTITLILIGVFLTPTALLGGGFSANDCTGDVIAEHESLGHKLDVLIPEASQVFWFGASPIPLLYMSGIDFYPQSLNGKNNIQEGDTEVLLKNGAWNQEIGEEWFYEADYLIIEKRFISGWMAELIKNSNQHIRIAAPKFTAMCNRTTELIVYQNMTPSND